MNRILCYIFLGIFCCSCSPTSSSTRSADADETRQHYTSSFPARDVSRQLEQIQRSVLRFTNTGSYRTYFFYDRNITVDELKKADHTKIASRRSTIEESKAGTAVALLQSDDHTVLLTAQHTLSFPDTVIVYKKGARIPKSRYVESIAIKQRQRSYLYGNQQILPIDIIGQDPVRDLALIKVSSTDETMPGRPLSIPFGKAKNLRVGSFIYVMGYPLSSPMVTRGIVSAPDFDQRGKFLTDALFNHGISGGLIIASRTNFRSFEWVGMAVTASASEQQFLIPDPAQEKVYDHFEAYTDTAYVSKQRIINYGVTQATPIEQIVAFMLRYENELNNLGFSITDMAH